MKSFQLAVNEFLSVRSALPHSITVNHVDGTPVEVIIAPSTLRRLNYTEELDQRIRAAAMHNHHSSLQPA